MFLDASETPLVSGVVGIYSSADVGDGGQTDSHGDEGNELHVEAFERRVTKMRKYLNLG